MEGYAKLSERIAFHGELGIFRRFGAINAQSLLYLQAEIHELEADLRQYAREDADAKCSTRNQYSRNWRKLAHSPEDRKQWNTVCALREKLKEYNDNLVQRAIISRHYRAPRAFDLDILRTCLSEPGYPDYLLGLDSTIWDSKELSHDLITLSTNDSDDAFTIWIASHLVGPFHQYIGRYFKTSPEFPGMADYSDRAIARFSSLLATVISSVFPIVGVIVPYFVKDLLARIGIIAGFTATFSLVLALVTNARKPEIFGATAAFSAVLVVFLGSSP